MEPRRRPAIVLVTLVTLLLALVAAPSAGAATSSPRLSIGFGCATAASPGRMHCLGRIRAHRART